MSKLLLNIFVFVVGLMVIAFSVNNRDVVAIDIWPAPYTFDLPVFGVALIGIAIGFVWGAVVAWLGAGRTRQKVRDLARDMEVLLRDKSAVSQKLAKLEQAEKQATIPPPPADAA